MKAAGLRKERMAKSSSGLRQQMVEARKNQVLNSMKGKKGKKSKEGGLNVGKSLQRLGGSARNLFAQVKPNNTAPMLPPARPTARDEADDAAASSEAKAETQAEAAAFAAAPESDSDESDAEQKAQSAFTQGSRAISIKNVDPSDDGKSNGSTGEELAEKKVAPSPFAHRLEALVGTPTERKERRLSIHAAQNTHERSIATPHNLVDFTHSGIEVTQKNKCISAKHLVSTLTETQNVWLRHVLSELEILRLLLIALQSGDTFDGNRLQSGIQICQTTLNIIHTCIKNVHGFMDSNHLVVGELEEDEQVCYHGKPHIASELSDSQPVECI